jgi:hypothetical protein
MAAAMPYHLSDHPEFRTPGEAPGREVLSAWVMVVLLVLGAIVSFTLDHVVTMSPDPVATYGETLRQVDENARELRDDER